MVRNDFILRPFACGTIIGSVLLLHATFLVSQTADPSHLGEVRTVVRDPTGVVIPNAEVTFRGEKTVTAKTTQDGSIRVQLPYGPFSVTVAKPGFTTSVEHISIQTAGPPDLEIVLQLAFSPCDPCLDVGSPELQTSVLARLIETVRVPDEETALRMAEPELIKIYGKRQIDYEKPLRAKLDGGIWTVHGTLCCPDRNGHRTCEQGECLGGVAVLRLRQSDGKILSIMHYK